MYSEKSRKRDVTVYIRMTENVDFALSDLVIYHIFSDCEDVCLCVKLCTGPNERSPCRTKAGCQACHWMSGLLRSARPPHAVKAGR